jgi:predicted alpha/beta superfamily hydrolase
LLKTSLSSVAAAEPSQKPSFDTLPHNEHEPSELDDNPRYLRCRNFSSKYLASKHDILVYLPEAYLEDPQRRFPVFYLNDGQNLFDGRTSYVPQNTWNAGITADQLASADRITPIILVGINHSGIGRMAEYTPDRDPRMGGGDGLRYGLFLIEELKPLIDSTFRTLTGPQDTALGGSSLGGLISLALGLEHPGVFGKLAVCSPSVWWNGRSILQRVSEVRSRPDIRIWLDMGTAEGLRHLRDADLLHYRLQRRGWRDNVNLRYLRVSGAPHTESAWAARFGQVLRFLFPPQPSS